MIGNSFSAYVFIRTCVFFLHWIAPLSTLYCFFSLFYTLPLQVPSTIRIAAAFETAFFLFVYHPHRLYLQRPATHPPPLERERRQELFDRCHDSILSPEEYLSKWFMGACLADIRRENVKEFLRWAFFNAAEPCAKYDDELEEYVDRTEKMLGRKLEAGVGPARCIRLTIDKVDMLHRSLTWYMCIFVVDTIASVYLRLHAFEFYRSSIARFPTVFPFRPLHQSSKNRSPVQHLTYWHRPHTSKTRLPVLFIHGIGVGLYPYTNFLAEINTDDEAAGVDGQIGIVAVEIMSVSSRITGEALSREDMCAEIEGIVKAHGWERFVLVSHSYGSIIATHLLRTTRLASRIGPILFIDPVCFLLHLPDVAYNFTCRKPKRAAEWQLYYFGAKDIGVSHTLGRRFFWSENILWKEDIRNHRVTVAMGGIDLIVNTAAVKSYLTHNTEQVGKEQGNNVDVMWFDNLDHAQVFDKRKTRKQLGDVVRRYCDNDLSKLNI